MDRLFVLSQSSGMLTLPVITSGRDDIFVDVLEIILL